MSEDKFAESVQAINQELRVAYPDLMAVVDSAKWRPVGFSTINAAGLLALRMGLDLHRRLTAIEQRLDRQDDVRREQAERM